MPFASYLGLTLELRGDELVCTLPADRRFLGNPVLDSLHGGVTAGLLECTATLALLWHKPREVVPRTIDFSIDFLLSGKMQPVFAHARLLKFGRRIANVHVDAWQTDRARPIGAGHGNFLDLRIALEKMLRIYFLQAWFNLSDPAVEEALYDSAAMRSFVGIDLGLEACAGRDDGVQVPSSAWRSTSSGSRSLPP